MRLFDWVKELKINEIFVIQNVNDLGQEPWSSGYGRRLCSKGRGFESQCHILDGHDIFSHWFVVKNCIVCLKRPKINEKEAGIGPFKKMLMICRQFNQFNPRRKDCDKDCYTDKSITEAIGLPMQHCPIKTYNCSLVFGG